MSSFTIKDLAKKLGVSPSTVSRALRDHPDISLATKRKVTEAAEKYHYQPNQLAQSLQKSGAIPLALLFPRFVMIFLVSSAV